MIGRIECRIIRPRTTHLVVITPKTRMIAKIVSFQSNKSVNEKSHRTMCYLSQL